MAKWIISQLIEDSMTPDFKEKLRKFPQLKEIAVFRMSEAFKEIGIRDYVSKKGKRTLDLAGGASGKWAQDKKRPFPYRVNKRSGFTESTLGGSKLIQMFHNMGVTPRYLPRRRRIVPAIGRAFKRAGIGIRVLKDVLRDLDSGQLRF